MKIKGLFLLTVLVVVLAGLVPGLAQASFGRYHPAVYGSPRYRQEAREAIREQKKEKAEAQALANRPEDPGNWRGLMTKKIASSSEMQIDADLWGFVCWQTDSYMSLIDAQGQKFLLADRHIPHFADLKRGVETPILLINEKTCWPHTVWVTF